jgi:two-component system chemotaxis response regulator CheB
LRRVRVAIVDDSTFVRKALVRILENEPEIAIVGVAASGEELMARLGSWRPEVITLDLNMPGLSGLETLDRIMAYKAIPVIILSTHSQEDAPLTLEALDHGAVDFIDKQRYSLVDFDALRQVLLTKILGVAGYSPPTAEAARSTAVRRSRPITVQPVTAPGEVSDVLLIGASTGGPPAIQRILESLESPPSIPIVVVQLMPEGFTTAFAQRLDSLLPFKVVEVVHRQALRPRCVYVAPVGLHVRLAIANGVLVAHRVRHPENVSHCPSVDVLFSSAARLWDQGLRSVAVLLTGMGRDGAAGMAELARRGACTLAQAESSCVVFGMPKAARELGAVREMLPLEGIARRVNDLMAHARSEGREAGGRGLFCATIDQR